MKRFIGVHTGEIMTGKGETVLKSDTNSACLVIVAYDANKKIGSLAHAMLMNRNGEMEKRNHTHIRSAEEAIEEMLNEMTMLGSNREEVEIRLVAGENVLHKKGDTIYNEKLNSAIDFIKEKHIRVTDHSAMDIGDKHVAFDVESGALSYK